MKNSGTQSGTPQSKNIEVAGDEQLLADIRRGDQKAAAKLVSAYEKTVYRICYRFFAEENEAMDAAQEVFIKIFRAIGRFEGRSSLKTWIYRIAANTCISLADKRRREKEGLLQTMMHWWESFTTTSPEDEVVNNEIRQLNQQVVAEKVARLPETYRMPVILKDIEGLPLEKISEVLEIPVGTVKSRINRGRRILQESLQAYVYGRLE